MRIPLVGCFFLLGVAVGAATGRASDGGLFRFREWGDAAGRISIDLGRLSDYTVSETLFGKFSENLGWNIYGGFWAQLLENPSLEPLSVCLGRDGYGWFDAVKARDLTHRDLLKEGDESLVAYGWYRWNGENTDYRLEGDAFNTSHSQEIDVAKVPAGAPGAGICQPLYLPWERTRRYRLSFMIRNTTGPVVAAVVDARRPERIHAVKVLDGSPGSEWARRAASLELALPEGTGRPSPVMFCLGLASPGRAVFDQVLLVPDDAVEGFDPEILDLARKTRITVLRFPGGNYVSGYHWKEDLAPLDERPTKPNPAWPIVDPHHVGTDEHIRLCRLLGAEPLICVNAGDGTPQEAADWVEYCNGSVDTRWGRVRAERGHPEPYDVQWWEIGNELWGSWQIGFCDAGEYARRYRAFHDAMKAVDPEIRIIACGHKGDVQAGWNDVLLDQCGDIVRRLSLHLLFANTERASPEFCFLSQMGYSHLSEDLLRSVRREGLRRGRDVRVAVTEALLLSHRPYQPRSDSMAEALYYAGILNSAIRTEGIVELFTHSAFVNHGGGIGRRGGRVYPMPQILAQGELRSLAGGRPVAFDAKVPFSEVPDLQPSWAGPGPKRFPLVDCMPVFAGDSLRLVLLNRDPRRSFPATIELRSGRASSQSARFMELSGASFHAANDPVQPDRVRPKRGVIPLASPGTIRIFLRPASLYFLTIPVDRMAEDGS